MSGISYMQNNKHIIKEINYGSDLYKESLDFRFKILRQPLGLQWSKKDLEDEDKQFHIAAFCEEKIIGTLVLKPISNNRIKLRQMAVDNGLQGSGIGRQIVQFAEKLAYSKNFKEIEMIARISALGFYQKLGYVIEGEEFEEVTVKSINMIKNLLN